MVAQTNHQTTKYVAENKWHGDLFTNEEKPTRQKPHWVIFRSPLPKFYYYHNKRLQVKKSQYLIPTSSWTLTAIPNWTYSIVTISLFDARLLSTWLTNCADLNTRLQSPTRESYWLQSSSVHPNNEDQEDAWSQNPMMHKHNNFFTRTMKLDKFFSDHNLLEQTLLNTCATCVHFDDP